MLELEQIGRMTGSQTELGVPDPAFALIAGESQSSPEQAARYVLFHSKCPHAALFRQESPMGTKIAIPPEQRGIATNTHRYGDRAARSGLRRLLLELNVPDTQLGISTTLFFAQDVGAQPIGRRDQNAFDQLPMSDQSVSSWIPSRS